MTANNAKLEKRLSADMSDTINQLDQPHRGNSMRHANAPAPLGKADDPGCCCPGKLPPTEVDVALIGAGIMSSTVGLMLRELEPSWYMVMFERLHAPSEESSNGFNNAGTGHAGFMEPNYTKEKYGDGGKLTAVTTDKVHSVCSQFMSSRQYWEYLVKKGLLPDPNTFIHQTNHIALGIGDDQVEFIRMRYECMKKDPLFSTMEICLPDEKKKAKEWAPLVVNGRDPNTPICMTKVPIGTDVDFGALTKAQVKAFTRLGGDLRLFSEVKDVKLQPDGKWLLTIQSNTTGRKKYQTKARFVFVGAGGWALLILQKARIPQVRGYMALPVTGDWAVCQNPDVVKQHKVKVYAPGAPGAPPMSMPHLDYRTIGGKEMLLFGPFGSMTAKFLRFGSCFDAIKALKCHNVCPTIGALSRNMSLAIMLMKDVFKSSHGKLTDIRHYFPEADADDWTLIPAGVRAQIIKKDPKTGKGMLQFGTEVVANDQGTIVGLLGASPGASTCVTVALDTLTKCFKDKPEWKRWTHKEAGRIVLQDMIPSFDEDGAPGDMKHLTPAAVQKINESTGRTLGIKPVAAE